MTVEIVLNYYQNSWQLKPPLYFNPMYCSFAGDHIALVYVIDF